ncbi:MAG: N-acetyl-gamma-glutamyl-phosphate reductase [Bacillota bacterium]
MIKVAILGGTGYAGMELIRLINAHPDARLVLATSESHYGKIISDVHPQFYGQTDLVLEKMETGKVPSSIDVVFCALPHGSSGKAVAALLEKGFKVIDLSADFRLKQLEVYRHWYNLPHPHPELLSTSVYGLPELYGEQVKTANLIANPGCYPTGIILALAPLLADKLVDLTSIIIDAKSGVSGAGRVPKQPFHFPECTENFKAYRVASHQHTPEIEQELSRIVESELKVTFTPHLVPMIRGILSAIYLKLNKEKNETELNKLYLDFYGDSPFVRILKPPALPETRFVRGSNYCDLAIRLDSRTGQLIIISAIDNLVKGAAGQAIQNMNLMFGFSETTGLGQVAL